VYGRSSRLAIKWLEREISMALIIEQTAY